MEGSWARTLPRVIKADGTMRGIHLVETEAPREEEEVEGNVTNGDTSLAEQENDRGHPESPYRPPRALTRNLC